MCTQGGLSEGSRRRERALQPHFLLFYSDCNTNEDPAFATRSHSGGPAILTSGWRARCVLRHSVSA